MAGKGQDLDPNASEVKDTGSGPGSLSSNNAEKTQNPSNPPTNRIAAGPRTEVGKRRSSQNAVKFGILSKATFIKGEPRAEYSSLLAGLWETYQPIGEVEEILVDKLASNLWRTRRLLIAESAEIRKKSDFREVINPHAQANLESLMFPKPDSLISRVDNPDALERCIELLTELEERIEENGFDEKTDSLLLRKIYGIPDESQIRETLQDEYSTWLNTAGVTEEERAREGYATPEECKANLLQAIAAEITRLTRDSKKRTLIESERKRVEILRQNVPDSPGLDRLLRYESSLERAFDRTLTQLE